MQADGFPYQSLKSDTEDDVKDAASLQAVSVDASTASAPPLTCRICGSDESFDEMIQPCNCSGSVRAVHSACLQTWIASRPAPDARLSSLEHVAANRSRMTCEICHSDYRVTLEYTFKFSCSSCWTPTSLGHIFELLILTIMMGMAFCLWPILSMAEQDGKQPAFGSHETDSVVVPIISAVLAILTLLAMAKVCKRWRRTNSILRIQGPPVEPLPIDVQVAPAVPVSAANAASSCVSSSSSSSSSSSFSFLSSSSAVSSSTAEVVKHDACSSHRHSVALCELRQMQRSLAASTGTEPNSDSRRPA